jgi:hypothetical protein
MSMILAVQASASLPNPPDTLWAMTYDAGNVEKAYMARTTDDGGYIVCGSTRLPDPGDTDAYLVRTGRAGDVIWTGSYGGAHIEEFYDVLQTSDGGYAAVGYTSTNTAGYFDVYFIRTDAGGDTLWTRTYGGSVYDYGYSVAETPDGGFIIAGRTSSFGRGWRCAYFIRTDAYGDTLWTRAHGGWGKEEAYSVIALAGGGYAAVGYTESYGAGGADVWLMRLDAGGDTVWTRTYGGSLDERGEDIKRTADKGFIIAGSSSSFTPNLHDMYLVKVDAAGDTMWTRTYGGPEMEHARSVEQIPGGGYMVCGWTFSMGAGNGDAFLAALAPSGGCPQIQKVSDIPSDNGVYVEISWLPSFYDNTAFDSGIRRYKIWREVNRPAITFSAPAADDHGIAHRPADRRELTEQGALWKIIGQVPAVAGSVYTYIARTDCGPAHAGPCKGCFIVSGHTGNPGEYFESPVMCGYSVDNLNAPGGHGVNGDPEAEARAYLRVVSPAGGRRGCRIDFSTPDDGRASIDIFSVTGRKAATLLDGNLEAGAHSIDPGRLPASLRHLAPGTYFVRLETASVSISAKLVIVR